MSKIIVWINRNEAKLFEPETSDCCVKKFQISDSSQNIESQFTEIANFLQKSKKVYILGPDLSRFNFRTFLHEHFPVLARRIINSEHCDELPDYAIIDWFKSILHLWD